MLKIAKCDALKYSARLGGIYCKDKKIVGFNLYQRGVKRNLSTFDKTALDLLISQDKMIGCVKFFGVEENYEDPTYVTSSSDNRYKQKDGAVRWTFTFDKGVCFHKQLANLDSSENYEIAFVDSDGNETAKINKDGSVSGFKVNIFVNNRSLNVGSEKLPSTIMIDLLSEEINDWNKNSILVESDEFSYKDINPVTQVEIEVPNLVDEAISTTVSITNACSNVPVAGLTTTANWKLERNGVLESVSAVSAVNGRYTFTHTALNAGEKIRFLISVAGYPVYSLDTNYYAGASKIEEVA